MTIDVKELGTILSVWAHPDDETYLSAGAMALAVQNGQKVTCVTATRGEKGSWDEARWPSETMGKVREQELLRCLAILGIDDHRWLDYIDAECDAVPHEQAVAKIVALFEEVQPDTVLTFGPEGMTDHADHKAVHGWVTEAFHRAAKPGAALYYATQTKAWADKYVPILQRFDVFGPRTPPITDERDIAIHVKLEGEMRRRKFDAIMAHDSQVDGMRSVFGPDLFLEANSQEVFRLAERR